MKPILSPGRKRYGSASSVTGCVTPALRRGGEESIHTDQCTLGAVPLVRKGELASLGKPPPRAGMLGKNAGSQPFRGQSGLGGANLSKRIVTSRFLLPP